MPGSEYNKKLYWHYCMDAYLLPCQDVDWWIKDFTKTVVASAHTI